MLEVIVKGGNTLLMASIGLALFLFGMQRLEAGIRALGLSTFQVWLRRATRSATASALTGIGVTALLQSSSLVSLLVLAFASAGVLPLYNAIGILIGANLGTTFTGWVVTAIGFKLSLDTLMLPLLGIGAALQWWEQRAPRVAAMGWLLFGIGMLLFGLDIMRTTTEQLTDFVDLGALQGHGVAVYFLTGILVAALIQSSSATMMLTLMTLNSGIISLEAAAAIVIGADLGTTSTTVLASLGGSVVKRQLALAHLVFNLCVDTAALFLLLPALPTILHWLSLEDPLVALVGFHSLFNLLGVVVFVGALKPFTHWIGSRFARRPNAAMQLANQPLAVPGAALVAIDKAVAAIAAEFVLLLGHYLKLAIPTFKATPQIATALDIAEAEALDVDQRYRQIKAAESSIYGFAQDLEQENLSKAQRGRLAAQRRMARAFAYSAKTLKDIHGDLVALGDSSREPLRELYRSHRELISGQLEALYTLYQSPPGELRRDEIETLEVANEQHFETMGTRVSELMARDVITGEQLSTLLNINRDIHHAFKGLLRASRHWWIEEELT